MKYEWEMSPEVWGRYKKDVDKGNPVDGDFLGCARIGEICFDIVSHTDEDTRKNDIWFLVFIGGVDDGYGYSAADAFKTGKYKDKYEVPDEEMYPYSECGYGELGICSGMSLEAFKKKAEKEFDVFLEDASEEVKEAAKQPLHIY